MYTFAQILGIAGIALAFFIYISKSRRVILLAKFSSDILWSVHYLLLGAWSGAALNVLAMAREVVFYNKAKKWASSRLWLYLFVGLTMASALSTWEGPSSLLPMAGSVCAVISFWCTKPMNIRLLAIPAHVLWTIYNIIHGSVTGGISSGIQIVSVAVGIVREVRGKKAAEKE